MIGNRGAMDLLGGQKDEIYARTFGILGDLLDNRASAREAFVDLSATLLQAVHSAIADSAEEWNRSRSSIVQRIPPEVLAHCALWMDFEDRVTASHICRHFRAVMLGAPTLWACIRITSSLSDDVGLHKVQSLLQRSAALPLELCFTRGASSSEMDACRPQFTRLRILELSEVPAPASLEYPMPSLEIFSVSTSSQQQTPMEIPASWTADGAPELRVLALPAFSLPDVPQTFRNVTHFSASMKLHTDAAHLFTYFPRLVALSLTDVTHDSLVPRGSPPPSLEALALAAVNDTAIDYMDHIEPYGTRPLRRVLLGGSLTLAPPLRMFTRTHERPWSMSIKVGLAELRTYGNGEDDDMECIVVLGSIETAIMDWPLTWEHTGPFFTRLVDLDISLAAFADLMWINPSMPRLRNLVIGVHDPDDEDEVGYPSWTVSSQSASLIASELRAISLVVTFDAEGGAKPEIDRLCLRWLEVALPDLLQNCIVYNGLLERISYSGPGAGNQSAFPIQLLRDFAQNVFLDDVQVLDAENQSDPVV